MLRLCTHTCCPGTATVTLLLPLKRSVHNSHACGLSTQSEEAFVSELQARVSAAAAVQCSQLRLHSKSVSRSGLANGSWKHTGRSRRGQLFKLATAAVAGVLSLEVLREHYSGAQTHPVQQSTEAHLMADMQRNLTNPALRPGYLKVCSQWLQQRQSLLQAEHTAWQTLPPSARQASRLQEIDTELTTTAVTMDAVLTTMQHDRMKSI